MLLPTQILTATAGTPMAEIAPPKGEKSAQNSQFSSILARQQASTPGKSGAIAQLAEDQPADDPASAALPDTGKDLPAATSEQNLPGDGDFNFLIGSAVSVSGTAVSPDPEPAHPAAPASALQHLASARSQGTLPDPALRMAEEAAPSPELAREVPRQTLPVRSAMPVQLRGESGGDKAAPQSAGPELALVDSLTGPTPTSPAAPFAVPSPGPAQPQAGLLIAPAIERPQDFAQLIDRLAAAREANQPQAVTVALAHAEFGKVELRFGNDSDGLSVSMTSADPDFARAVQAAVPPVGATTDAGSTQQRSQGGGSASDQTSSQSGNAAPERRNGKASTNASQNSASNSTRGQRDHTGHGIFA